MKVFTVLVIDATTGQNGMQQAREFDKALDLDALILTKLDGTAKGGIALAISHELDLPIIKIGVGEAIDDLRDFDAEDFVAALIGDFEEEDLEEEIEEEGTEGETTEEAFDETSEHEPADAFDEAASSTFEKESEDIETKVPSETISEASDSLTEDDQAAESQVGSNEPAENDVADQEPGKAQPAKTSSTQGPEKDTMTWEEFVKFDEAQKAEKANKPKKHFWEKW